MDFDTNGHSVYSLNYHLILVVKYRRHVFTNEISQRAKEIFTYIGKSHNAEIIEWNHDEDHIHVLFKTRPQIDLGKFINAYKSASSRLLKKEFPEIQEKLWDKYFWSASSCIISVGGAPIEIIKQYIENQ